MTKQTLYSLADEKLAKFWRIHDDIEDYFNKSIPTPPYEKIKDAWDKFIEEIKEELKKTSFHYEIKELKYLIISATDCLKQAKWDTIMMD